MQPTAYAVLYTIPALISLGLGIASTRSSQREGRTFGALLGALALWCGCHALSLLAGDSDTALLWQQLAALGGVAAGPLWLMASLAWAEKPLHLDLTRSITVILAVLGGAAVLTNGTHHMWWSAATLAGRPGAALDLVRGPLAWANLALAYGYGIAGAAVLLRHAARCGRPQLRWAALAALAPIAASITSVLWPALWPMDEPAPLVAIAAATLLFVLRPSPERQLEGGLVALFEQASDGLLFLGRDGAIDSMNAAARQILGISPDQPVSSLVQADARIGDAILTSSLSPHQEISDYYVTPMGKREIQIRAVPIQGKKHQQLIRLRDVTEQRAVERTRVIYQQHLAILQQIGHTTNAPSAAQPLTPITQAILQTLHWHRGVIGLLQQDENTLHLAVDVHQDGEETLEGRFIDSYMFGNIVDMVRSTQPQVLQMGTPTLAGTPTELVLKCLGAPTVLCIPLHSAGKPIGMLFLGSATTRSLLEDELRLMELIGTQVSNTVVRSQLYTSARQAEVIKSSFLATISHELRTPLTSMLGFIDMLKSNVFGQMPETSLEAFAHVEQSSRALHRLIDDMIDLAKMEAGHMAVELYPVNVELVLYMVVHRLMPQLQERGLTLRQEIEPDLPLIQANSARLEQVFDHILSNAIKFSSVGEIAIRIYRLDAMVAISIRDSGIGIAKTNQQRIFESFSQLEPTLTRRYGGAGIGLSISKHLMALMGGTITLESELGAGSVFRCCFHPAVSDSLRAFPIVISEEPSYIAHEPRA